jgi:hypothetical protein
VEIEEYRRQPPERELPGHDLIDRHQLR